jgi:hypothetical protein
LISGIGKSSGGGVFVDECAAAVADALLFCLRFPKVVDIIRFVAISWLQTGGGDVRARTLWRVKQTLFANRYWNYWKVKREMVKKG